MLRNYIDNKKGTCRVLISPVDVQLDCDDKTMVEPDLIVLCDMKKYTERCIVGAPDFLIEVLSPGTRKKDCTLKLQKYRKAGIREYWIIDWESEHVIVYHLEKKCEPALYGFDSRVPVGIYDGELLIDFQKVKDDLMFYGISPDIP